MPATEVIMNPLGLEALLHSPLGPVARAIERRAIRVQSRATELCPVDTGRLRASIHHVLGVDAEGVYADVGSNVEYAAYVELGTRNMDPQPFLRPALDDVGGPD